MRGAWIEMFLRVLCRFFPARRSPCGERGLKWQQQRQRGRGGVSLPVRGAWIEIGRSERPARPARRSPCGERGLKCVRFDAGATEYRRSPCGERGLKFFAQINAGNFSGVAPRAGSVD